MKKLLTILGALGILVSTATVVACGTTDSIKRFSTPTLAEELRDKILVSLFNDNDDQLSNITTGKRFSDINFANAVLQMVQDKTSRISNAYFKNKINGDLKLNEQVDVYQNQLDEITSDIAQNQFYLQYTNNLLTNPTTSIDEKLNIGLGNGPLYALNPKNLLRNDTESGIARKDSNKYFIYMNESGENWVRWEYIGENDETSNHELLPNIEQLEKNRFIILRDSLDHPSLDKEGKETITEAQLNNPNSLFFKDSDGKPVIGTEKYSIYSKDRITPFKMNGKTALEYRFQDYFTKQIANNFFSKKENEEETSQINFFENLLTMTYLDTNFYNVLRNEQTQSQQDNFLNISSNLAQTIQSWSQSDGYYQSKLKMVWSFTFKTSEVASNAWNKLKTEVKLNNNGSFNSSSRQTLRKVYELLSSVQGNDSDLGSDPFFNFNGYNGLVKNNEDGTSISSVDGNLSVNKEAETKIAQANGPSILSKDNGDQPYVSGTKQNEYEFILVLPIYLIDLLNDRTTGFDNGQSTTAFVTFDDLKNENGNGNASDLYPSYSKAVIEESNKIINSKKGEINSQLKDTKNFYIYVDGVPYTISQFKANFQSVEGLPEDATIWNNWLPNKTVVDNNGINKTVDGLQFTLQNTIENTIGNLGINQKVKVGNYEEPADSKGFKFSKENGQLYVEVPNKPELIGTVEKFDHFNLSFDDGLKDGLYTINGILNDQNSENEGKTYSYRINMGDNASNRDKYIRSPGFNYYTANISSLDISNLSSEKKSSLLREIEFITSKETGVGDTAAGAIFPLFLSNDQILYQPLYDKLKQYLIDEEGGTSD